MAELTPGGGMVATGKFAAFDVVHACWRPDVSAPQGPYAVVDLGPVALSGVHVLAVQGLGLTAPRVEAECSMKSCLNGLLGFLSAAHDCATNATGTGSVDGCFADFCSWGLPASEYPGFTDAHNAAVNKLSAAMGGQGMRGMAGRGMKVMQGKGGK